MLFGTINETPDSPFFKIQLPGEKYTLCVLKNNIFWS